METRISDSTEITEQASIQQDVVYGGFWRRAAAFTYDCLMFGVCISVIANWWPSVILGYVRFPLFVLASYLYFILLESSARQATLGKSVLGLRVVGADGGRISIWRAAVRNLGKALPIIVFKLLLDEVYLSDVLFSLVLLVCACVVSFSRQKRALHDFAAKTYVVGRPTSRSHIMYTILGIFIVWCTLNSTVVFPAISRVVLLTNCNAVAARGKAVHAAIIKAQPALQGKAYTTSTDYFSDLLTEGAVETSNFAGAGVPCSTTGVLTANNNMWAVLVNTTDRDSGNLPLLITRNVDVETLNRALKAGITAADFPTRVPVSELYRAPFRNKQYVLVRKDGKTFTAGWPFTLGDIFNHTEIPPRAESEPPLLYLQP
ncbi:MAG: RDD family protein [Kiritimatiellaeota bacterium]|nr:RDD family protein [Kiritimatiellota bacterium]